MEKFNVTKPKKYTTKAGEEKTAWLPVGVITKFQDGGMILELNITGEEYKVFPMEKREQPTNNVANAPF